MTMKFVLSLFLLLLAVDTSLEQGGCPLDLMLLVDHSGAIRDSSPGDVSQNLNWRYIRDFLKAFVDKLPISESNTRIGLVTFGDTTTTIFNLNEHYTTGEIDPLLENLQYLAGSSNVTGAFRTVRTQSLLEQNGRRSNLPAVCLLLVGYPPVLERDRTIPTPATPFTDEVNRIKPICRIVILVGGGPNIASTYVPVASSPAEFLNAASFSVINQYVDQTIGAIYSQCPTSPAAPTTTTPETTTVTTVPTTQPPTTTPPSTVFPTTITPSTVLPTTILPSTVPITTTPESTLPPVTTPASTPQQPTSAPEVQTTQPATSIVPSTAAPTTIPAETTVIATSEQPVTTVPPVSTTTLPPAPGCSHQADVVLMVDTSGSIGEDNFNKIRSFLHSLVLELDIDQGAIRIGLVTFADTFQQIFHLDAFANRADIAAAVSNITFTRGTTNTADAFSHTRTDMFGSHSRPTARKIAFIVTDGGSNDKEATQREASLLKASGVYIVVLGTGNWLDMSEVNNTASYPYTSNALIVNDYNDLASVTESIRNLLCDNVDECGTSNPCHNSGTCANYIGTYVCENCGSGFSGKNCDVPCSHVADVIVAVDGSTSIEPYDFHVQLDFVRELAYGLNIDGESRMGMLIFADQAVTKFNLNDFNKTIDVLNAISAIQPGGITNIAAAVTLANTMFSAAPQTTNPKIFILITNGQSENFTLSVQEAMKARENGISILVVAVGNGVSWPELRGIASFPVNVNLHNVSDFSELSSLLSRLIESQCNSVDECAASPCQNAGQCTDLINGYVCSCGASHTGKNCQRTGNGRNDIVIAIDTSGSIRNERFAYILDYLASLVDDMEISADKTRVGVVQYADTTQQVIGLDTYTNVQDIIWVIQNIAFRGGRTNTAECLQMIRDVMYKPPADRSDAPNVVILVSDGNSNVNQVETIPSAISLRIAGIHIVVVAVGTDVNMYELTSIVSPPINQSLFVASSYKELPLMVNSLIAATSNDVDRCAPDPCQNGGQCYNDLKRYVCRCTPDWSGITCTNRCPKVIDLAFVLDISGSGNFEDVWRINIPFVQKVVADLPTSSDQFRIAVVTFGDGAEIKFYLNTYSTGEDILNALTFRMSIGQGKLEDALKFLHDTIFVIGNGRGARDNSGKYTIIITNSDSPFDHSAILTQAQAVKDLGVKLYALTIGSGPDPNLYQALVTEPAGDHLITMSGSEDVDSKAKQFVAKLCAL